MRDESESHCAPTNIDVRVMIGTFGLLGYPADGVDSFQE